MNIRLISLLLFSFVSGFTQASGKEVLAHIFPSAQAYPHSEKIAEGVAESFDYLLGLGSLQKIHGVWRPKESKRLEGDLLRLTYQISGGRDVSSAIEHLETSLSPSAVEMYRCNGRGCGSSAQWVSLIFKQRELYGLDSHQYYRAYRIPTGRGLFHMAVYGVKRANGRQYLHLDIINSAAVNAESLAALIAESLEQRKIYQFVGLSDSQLLNNDQLEAVISVLQTHSGKLAIVSHLYGTEAVEVLIQRSTDWSDAVKRQLSKSGASGEKIVTFGAGPLQPAAGQFNRVELVLP